MRTLALTSPHMRGNDVLKAQELLKHHNRFGVDYLRDQPDGDFGPMTAQACKRAKYWLGYPARKIRGDYGDPLRSYLLPLDRKGAKRLSLAMAIRRRRRLRRKNRVPVGAKALAIAATQIGVHESPTGSNRVLYSVWYGLIGPWCAMFATWCLVRAGSKAFVRGSRYSYVPTLLEDARAGRNHLTTVKSPQHGDLAIYDWDNDGTPDHVEFFSHWLDASPHVSFETVGGNTSGSSNSNGGAVMRRQRYTSDVIAFVRVGA